METPKARLTLITSLQNDNSMQIEANETNAAYVSCCANDLKKAKVGDRVGFPVSFNGKKLYYSVKIKRDANGEKYLDLNEKRMSISRRFKVFFYGETQDEIQARECVQQVLTRAVQCYSKDAKPAIGHKLNKVHDKPYSVIHTPKDERGKKGFPAVLYPSQCIKESMKSGIIDENKPLIMMFDLDEMLTTSASRTTKNLPKNKMYALDSELPELIKNLKQKYQKNEVPFKLVLLTNALEHDGQVADKLEVAGFKLSDFDYSPFREKSGDSDKKTGRAKDTLLKIQSEIGGSKDDCQIMFFDDTQTFLSDVDEAVSEAGMQNYHGFQTLAHLPISQINKMKCASHQNTANGNNGTDDAEIKKDWKVTEANLFRTTGITEDPLGEDDGWRPQQVDILSYLMLTSGNGEPVNFHHSPTPPTWKF